MIGLGLAQVLELSDAHSTWGSEEMFETWRASDP